MTKDTEQRIINAAIKVFCEKGYDGARTRDIANEAGITHALINYHFKSKENLFNVIIENSLLGIRQKADEVLNNPDTTHIEKINTITATFASTINQYQELLLFFVTQIVMNVTHIAQKLNIHDLYFNSIFYKQLKEQGLTDQDCINLYINIISLSILPFIGKNILKEVTIFSEQQFNLLIENRQNQIPQWIQNMFNI